MGSVTDDEFGESGVNSLMAERVIKGLHVLDTSAPSLDKPITIQMNNPGGEVVHGMAIYDAIRLCQNHVTVIVYGRAMSMGSIILQAADERIMTENSKFMIHYGYFGLSDHQKTVYQWVDESRKYDSWMEGMYLERIKEKHPLFTHGELEKMLNFDTILTAQETVELGLADRVI